MMTVGMETIRLERADNHWSFAGLSSAECIVVRALHHQMKLYTGATVYSDTREGLSSVCARVSNNIIINF